MNKFKLGLATLLAVAGFFSFYFFQDSPTVIRVVTLLLGLVLAFVVILFTTQGKQLFLFFQDSVEEVKKSCLAQ